MERLLIISLAVGIIAIAITKTHIFGPARDWADETKIGWLHTLASCPICLGFWISLVWATAYAPWEDRRDLVLAVFAVWGGSSLVSGVLLRLYRMDD